MIETLEQALGLHGALFLVGLISGVFPLMNAELVVIATATVVADGLVDLDADGSHRLPARGR